MFRSSIALRVHGQVWRWRCPACGAEAEGVLKRPARSLTGPRCGSCGLPLEEALAGLAPGVPVATCRTHGPQPVVNITWTLDGPLCRWCGLPTQEVQP